jgi:hypothetical protein
MKVREQSGHHGHISPVHGARELPGVTIDDYNAELRDVDGYIGDRASSRAFRAILDDWRDRLGQVGDDPLGNERAENVDRRRLDKLISGGDVVSAGLVLSAIEEFAQELTTVCRRMLRMKSWQTTERIIVGGGLRASRVGELAIGRANVLLKSEGRDIELQPIRHDPDTAGLLGSVQLVPEWMLAGHDAIPAVDIGGSNIRAGIVALHWRKQRLAGADVIAADRWRHRNEKPKRDEAIARLGTMLKRLIRTVKKQKHRLAPLVCIGCPGLISVDGSIERGGQNLPGNWENGSFNLPREICAQLPLIRGKDTHVIMHNDAVVQGLSELPWLQDAKHWGVLTIGTGLGNAHFTNRSRP